MTAVLAPLVSFIVPFFAATSMAGMGLGHSLRQVTRPFRLPGVLIPALLANFALSPLLAYAIARLLRLETPNAIGLFVFASGAGAPFVVALVKMARSDLTLGTGLVVTLLVATMAFMPVFIPAVLPWARVGVWDIARPLLLTMLLPLAVGLLVHARAPAFAAKVRPLFGKASQVALIVLLGGTFLLHFNSIAGLVGSGALAAVALYTLGAFLIGYTFGGKKPKRRAVMGLATGQRNVAAATIVATQAFEQSGPMVMVVVSSLVAFTVLIPAAFLLRRSGARRAEREREHAHGPGLLAGRHWRRA